jgi:tight adherence protein C
MLKNMDSTLVTLVLGAVTVAVLGLIVLFIGISRYLKSKNKVTSRLEHYVAPKHGLTSSVLFSKILPREISGSLFSRIFPPLFSKVARFFTNLTPETQLTKLDHDLVIAGNPGGLRAGGFFGIQILVIIVGTLIAILYVTSSKPLDFFNLIVGVFIVLLAFLLPKYWLNSQVRKVKDEIRRGLPDALDMLSVCASAGMGFDQSLQKISIYWHTKLGDELKRTIHEMEMGVTRSTSLQNLADRLNVDELSSFIGIIIQAERMGMSYAEVLHSQAVQMRVLRQFRAREIANKLPAKMIVPLALFIFPALIAVILGPVIPTLASLFN